MFCGQRLSTHIKLIKYQFNHKKGNIFADLPVLLSFERAHI